jgi:thioester reductase-like protein
MKKLPLSLEPNVAWLRVLQSTSDFIRKYHTVKIENSDEWNDSTVKVLRQHGSEMRCLELKNCMIRMNKAKVLNEMLKVSKKLEVLKLTDVDCDIVKDKKLDKIESVKLPKLKSVVLQDTNLAVSKIYFCKKFI